MVRWLVSDQNIVLKSTDVPDNVDYKGFNNLSPFSSSEN